MAAGAMQWLQKLKVGFRSQAVDKGAKMWLEEPKCGYGTKHIAFRVKVWFLEHYFCIALQGRAQR